MTFSFYPLPPSHLTSILNRYYTDWCRHERAVSRHKLIEEKCKASPGCKRSSLIPMNHQFVGQAYLHLMICSLLHVLLRAWALSAVHPWPPLNYTIFEKCDGLGGGGSRGKILISLLLTWYLSPGYLVSRMGSLFRWGGLNRFWCFDNCGFYRELIRIQ